MALADLLATLDRDAAAEARALRDAADAEAARIDAASARACDERLAAAARQATEEHRAIADGRCADVHRERRRAILETRAAMLARILDAVHAALPTLVDDALRMRLRAAITRHIGDDAIVREAPTGVVAELPDGTRVDATLEAMLVYAWPRLAAEAVALVDTEGS